ncbi:MAG: RluA family pseudouridine synthase [Alphaproteobacteria bacterium]
MTTILVKPTDKLGRIDKFLCHKFDISFSLSQKIIREKKILINQKTAQISNKIQAGDQIIINDKLTTRNPKQINKISLEKIKKFWKNTIYEDENIIAINKPSGLASQGGSGIEISVDDFVRDRKFQLVHRLDKDTSGLLLIAKTKASAEFLTNLFKNKEIEKTYIALVDGVVKKENGIIDIPLSKQNIGKNEKVQVDIEFGKKATTKYRVLNIFENFTELELKPITGRTHQLRVHCKEIGHPIINDYKYGGKKVAIKDKFSQLCLHSYQIKIHDYYGKELLIITPYPNFTFK